VGGGVGNEVLNWASIRLTGGCPGDLPFIYDIEKHNAYCCACEDWVSADTITFKEPDNGSPLRRSVYYTAESAVERFSNLKVSRFNDDRKNYRGLYFRPDAE
jgi:hypothetical protein